MSLGSHLRACMNEKSLFKMSRIVWGKGVIVMTNGVTERERERNNKGWKRHGKVGVCVNKGE